MMTSTTVDPAVLKTKHCETSTCGQLIELRDYLDRHLPARWYDFDTDHPHTCRAAFDAYAEEAVTHGPHPDRS